MNHSARRIADDLRRERQAQFVQNSRNFWANHGLPLIDRALLIMVPSLIFAPAYIAWLK